MAKTKKWYSFSENNAYEGIEPAFFDIKNKAWKQTLEKNTIPILEELAAIIRREDKNIIPYFNQTLANKAQNWTIFPLYIWGKKLSENCLKCPQTVAVIESIPGMSSCSFSILKPNSTIKPHSGDSNVMYRCHLTLKSPGELPVIGMRVKQERTSWKKGELFAFCDAYEHEVWNNTGEERWVLIVDILREEFVADKKKICAEVTATLYWQLKFQKSKLMERLPKFARKFLMQITAKFIS